jgi:hypothetical protein
VRDWVGLEMTVFSYLAEIIVWQAFQLFCDKRHPRTLQLKGFSLFDPTQPLDLMPKKRQPRKRTLKTKYSKELRVPPLKSLGNEGIY